MCPTKYKVHLPVVENCQAGLIIKLLEPVDRESTGVLHPVQPTGALTGVVVRLPETRLTRPGKDVNILAMTSATNDTIVINVGHIYFIILPFLCVTL